MSPAPGSNLGGDASYYWQYLITNTSSNTIELNYQAVDSLTGGKLFSYQLGSGAVLLNPSSLGYYKFGDMVTLSKGQTHQLDLSLSLDGYLDPGELALKITITK